MNSTMTPDELKAIFKKKMQPKRSDFALVDILGVLRQYTNGQSPLYGTMNKGLFMQPAWREFLAAGLTKEDAERLHEMGLRLSEFRFYFKPTAYGTTC